MRQNLLPCCQAVLVGRKASAKVSSGRYVDSTLIL